MKKVHSMWTLLVGISLILASCKMPGSTPATPSLDPNVVFTAAAQTAAAMMTQIAAITPSQLPTTPTVTLAPATETPTPTTVSLTATPTQAGVAVEVDQAVYQADVTVPDGSNFAPGQAFVKTWQIMNKGSSTWTTDYSLVFVQDAQMGGPAFVPVPNQVAPGQSVNISVNLIAPTTTGNYIGYWKMRNAKGQLFDYALWVKINVVVSPATGTPTVTPTQGTPGATITPATPTATSVPQGAGVSNVSLAVDNPDFTGQCPHTFVFTGQFTLNKAANVTYKLDAETGFAITLPDPVTMYFEAGTYTVGPYILEFTSTASGWARLHFTAPNEIMSSKVNFTLTCQ